MWGSWKNVRIQCLTIRLYEVDPLIRTVSRNLWNTTVVFSVLVGLLLVPSVTASAQLDNPAQLRIAQNPYAAENAPKSKYIKEVSETRTTANLHLRSSASTSGKSLGLMNKGTVVVPTGQKSGNWWQLKWNGKTGWASSDYLQTKTVTNDESVRYIRGYVDIMASAGSTQRVGAVNFRTQVTLLDVKDRWSHIRTEWYHGWIPSSKLSTSRPAKKYVYVQTSGAYYSHASPSQSTILGRIHRGERYEVRRWDSLNRRDEILVNNKWVWTNLTHPNQPKQEIRYAQSRGNVYDRADKASGKVVGTIHRGDKVIWGAWDAKNWRDEVKLNGKWVWTDVTNRKKPATQYRYAQKNGTLYDRADKKTSKKVGTIARGTQVEWGAWDGSNRRDEIKYNGTWVWSDVTAKDKPTAIIPETKPVDPYARFSKYATIIRETPQTNPYAKQIGLVKKGDKVTVTGKADGEWLRIKYGSITGYVRTYDLRKDSPNSVAVYGTLRTGQSAYNMMAGFQQKIMDQRVSKASLYQLWSPNLTFMTNGSGTVVAEQFQYSDSKGPDMMKKLDIYEGSVKYQGKPMYSRQKVSMSDSSVSWSYKTTAVGEQVTKKSGRLIPSGDFLKRH